MSRGSTSSGTALNYRPCHLKIPQLLTAFSPRYFDIENRSASCCPSARTSISVGEEPFPSRKSTLDFIPATCRTQTCSPYFTKYLENKIATIQAQHDNVSKENMNLNNQLSKASLRNQELEEKIARLEEERAVLWKRCENEESRSHQRSRPTLQRGVNTTLSGLSKSLEASTFTDIPIKYDRAVQTIQEQQQHRQQPLPVECNDGTTKSTDLVSVTKSELNNLESDMKSLRDAVRAKEEMWEQAIEREQNYREHLARLSVELITVRQLSDSRYNELQTHVQKLTEKKEELRIIQKDLALAKKTITKLQKRQRNAEECNQELLTLNANDNLDHRDRQCQKSESQFQYSVTNQTSKVTSLKHVKSTPRHSARDYNNVKGKIDDTSMQKMKASNVATKEF